MKQRKVKLTYFKDSGKYYSEGEYLTSVAEYHDWMLYNEVKEMRALGKLPGLIEGATEFDILVTGEDVVPALLKRSNWP